MERTQCQCHSTTSPPAARSPPYSAQFQGPRQINAAITTYILVRLLARIQTTVLLLSQTRTQRRQDQAFATAAAFSPSRAISSVTMPVPSSRCSPPPLLVATPPPPKFIRGPHISVWTNALYQHYEPPPPPNPHPCRNRSLPSAPESGPFVTHLLDRADPQAERQACKSGTLKAWGHLKAGRLSSQTLNQKQQQQAVTSTDNPRQRQRKEALQYMCREENTAKIWSASQHERTNA